MKLNAYWSGSRNPRLWASPEICADLQATTEALLFSHKATLDTKHSERSIAWSACTMRFSLIESVICKCFWYSRRHWYLGLQETIKRASWKWDLIKSPCWSSLPTGLHSSQFAHPNRLEENDEKMCQSRSLRSNGALISTENDKVHLNL